MCVQFRVVNGEFLSYVDCLESCCKEVRGMERSFVMAEYSAKVELEASLSELVK